MENEALDDTDTGPTSKTLASLKKKKEALRRLRADFYAKIKATDRDIAALDAAMLVFDNRTWASRQAADKKGRKRKYIAARFILDFLREAEKPVLASAITDAWIEEQGMTSDPDTRQIYGQRVSNALSNMKRKSMVTQTFEPGSRPLWSLVQ